MAAATLEERLAALSDVREGVVAGDAADALLRRSLGLKTNIVVQRAAEVAGEQGRVELAGLLVEAFVRFAGLAWEKDKGCRAKAACVGALVELDATLGPVCDEVFEPASRWVQLEPAFGPPVDTAAAMRPRAALGLLRAGDARAMPALADLLADGNEGVRAAAADLAGGSGRADAVPLVRYALGRGEDDPEVRAALWLALVRVDEDAGFARAVAALGDEDDGPAAALALGESGHAEAFGALTAWLPKAPTAHAQRAGATAVALLRSEASRAWLLGVVRDGEDALAREVVRALALYRHEDELADRVRDAALGRDDPSGVASAVRESWG